MRTASRTFVQLLLVTAIGMAVYWHTLDVPFYFDDYINIAYNPIVKNLGYFADPASARGLTNFAEYPALRTRYIGHLSFALNYRAHGLDVLGYHLVNIAVHLINACLVYALCLLLLSSPRMRNGALASSSGMIATLAAIIFAVHPVQTQGVTYIVQRLASLSTLFYLLSLVLYLKGRLSGRAHWHVLAVIAAALAMNVKQTAFTLPIAAAIVEFVFFSGPAAARLRLLAPMMLTMLIVPLNLIGLFDGAHTRIMSDLEDATHRIGLSRLDYFITQQRVLITYARLLALPINQNFDYDFPIGHSLFSFPVIFGCILAIVSVGWSIRQFVRWPGAGAALMVAFGVIWFYLTLSVESTVIVLDPIFEHRLYLPLAGISIAQASAWAWAMGKAGENFARRSVALAFALAVCMLFAGLSVMRNEVWRTPVNFYADNVQKSPHSARAHYNLGVRLLKTGETERARPHLREAMRLDRKYLETYLDVAFAYARKPDIAAAMAEFQKIIWIMPESAVAHAGLGFMYLEEGNAARARGHFIEAYRLDPSSQLARQGLELVNP